MKQHDDDAAPPQVPPLRRRTGAQPPVWPFPAALSSPPGDNSDPVLDPASITAPPQVDRDATHAVVDTTPQRRKP